MGFRSMKVLVSLMNVLIAGLITFTGRQQAQAQVSAGTAVIPAWVPIYPGAKVSAPTSKQARNELNLWFTITTSDPCSKVWRFYEERLTHTGFSIVKGPRRDEDCVGVLESHNASGTRLINLTGGSLVKGTRYTVEVVQRNADQTARQGDGPRQDKSATKNEIPAWVPAYPRWIPRNIEGRQSGSDYSLSFTFTSRDDIRSILAWYQDKLRQIGFRVDMDVIGTKGVLRSSTRDNKRALKIEVSSSGGQNVVLLDIREGS